MAATGDVSEAHRSTDIAVQAACTIYQDKHGQLGCRQRSELELEHERKSIWQRWLRSVWWRRELLVESRMEERRKRVTKREEYVTVVPEELWVDLDALDDGDGYILWEIYENDDDLHA